MLEIEFEFSEHDAFCKLWDIDDVLGPKTLRKINRIKIQVSNIYSKRNAFLLKLSCIDVSCISDWKLFPDVHDTLPDTKIAGTIFVLSLFWVVIILPLAFVIFVVPIGITVFIKLLDEITEWLLSLSCTANSLDSEFNIIELKNYFRKNISFIIKNNYPNHFLHN